MRPGESPTEKGGQPGLGVSVPRAALHGFCPRCGGKSLFEAPAAIAERCGACGLDYRPLERGSRWAGVVTLLLAAIMMGAALAIDALLAPPLWLQMAFWAPVTVGGTLFALRLFKTLLLYAAYERMQQ